MSANNYHPPYENWTDEELQGRQSYLRECIRQADENKAWAQEALRRIRSVQSKRAEAGNMQPTVKEPRP